MKDLSPGPEGLSVSSATRGRENVGLRRRTPLRHSRSLPFICTGCDGIRQRSEAPHGDDVLLVALALQAQFVAVRSRVPDAFPENAGSGLHTPEHLEPFTPFGRPLGGSHGWAPRERALHDRMSRPDGRLSLRSR